MNQAPKHGCAVVLGTLCLVLAGFQLVTYQGQLQSPMGSYPVLPLLTQNLKVTPGILPTTNCEAV
jgi:hypothetical protein